MPPVSTIFRRPAPSPSRRRRRLLPTLATLFIAASAQAAPALLSVQREDNALRVSASATLPTDARTVWNTLIGYERLPEFIPDMAASRTLQRDGDDALVEQRGRAGFGPIKRDFSLTLAVHEEPLQAVTARAVAGDFSRFESSYRLSADGDGNTRIEYAALIEPKSGIPPLMGVPVMEWAIRRQFDALLVEIERRASVPAARQ